MSFRVSELFAAVLIAIAVSQHTNFAWGVIALLWTLMLFPLCEQRKRP